MEEHHRCAICAAEFGSSQDLVKHERAEHTHSAGDTSTGGDEVAPESGSASPRAGREFSRRNQE